MANNCANFIEFTYENEEIYNQFNEELKSCVDNGMLDFSKFAKAYDFEIKDVYNDFRTKWMEIYIDDETCVMTIDSAWSPVIPFVDKIANKYPELDIRLEYSEPGCDFGGVYEIIDGVVSHHELDYQDYIIQYNSDMIYEELEYTTEDDAIEDIKKNRYFLALSEEDQKFFLEKREASEQVPQI